MAGQAGPVHTGLLSEAEGDARDPSHQGRPDARRPSPTLHATEGVPGPPPPVPPQEGLGLSPLSLRLLLWRQGPPGEPLPAPSGGLVWHLSWCTSFLRDARLLLVLALPGVQAAEGGSLRDARAGESSVHTGDTAHGCSGVRVCAAETNTRVLTWAPGPISSTRLVRPPRA